MSFTRVELVFLISVEENALLLSLTGNYVNDQKPTPPRGAAVPCLDRHRSTRNEIHVLRNFIFVILLWVTFIKAR